MGNNQCFVVCDTLFIGQHNDTNVFVLHTLEYLYDDRILKKLHSAIYSLVL